jgi:hypothetical protein
MPRVARPRQIAELTGAVRHNPQRYPQEPATAELGDPPEHLSPASRAVWDELVAAAVPGVLRSPDRVLLEITCDSLVQFREDPHRFPVTKLKVLRQCFARLGLT